MRPVTAPFVVTLPCTLPSSCTCSSHEETCAYRFCKSKYSRTSNASGICLFSSSVLSSTCGLPLGVSSFHTAPLASSLSATCCLLPGLNTVTLSLRRLPVFSDHLSSTIGGNTFWSSSSISFIFSLNVPHRLNANLCSSNPPLRSCC